MRMDRQSVMTASDIVNNWDYEEIKKILYEYGEERYAPRIASRIVANRPIRTTTELTEIIKEAMPAKALRENSIRQSEHFRPSESPSTMSLRHLRKR